ncbi:MAG: polysaccharide biosynthesis/export family protein, partial [Candidatus Eisenbacteria bacterium]
MRVPKAVIGVLALAFACVLVLAPRPLRAQGSNERSPVAGGNDAATGGSLAPSQLMPPNVSSPPLERQPGMGGPGLTDEVSEGVKSRFTGRFTLSGPIDPATYRVGPGDVLQLIMWGKVSKTLELDVSPEGHLLLPGVGTLPVSGHTLAAVEIEVVRVMSDQFRGVNMELRLLQPRTFRVYLTGKVKNPGPLDVSGSFRVGDIL